MDSSLGSVKGVSGTPMSPPPHQSQPTAGVPDVPQQPAPHAITQEDAKRAEKQGKPVSMSEEQWIRAVEKALKLVQGPITYLDFSVHKSTKEVMVKVMNRETGEVIREIPPEKHLDLVADLMKMAGILVDKRV
jgi:flagellar protein FlaG